MMSGTPKADLAALVMSGVFEPARGRFPEGFGRTGLAAPLAPIGPMEPIRSVLVWACGPSLQEISIVDRDELTEGHCRRAADLASARSSDRQGDRGVSHASGSRRWLPIRLEPSPKSPANSKSGLSLPRLYREAGYAPLAGSRSPTACGRHRDCARRQPPPTALTPSISNQAVSGQLDFESPESKCVRTFSIEARCERTFSPSGQGLFNGRGQGCATPSDSAVSLDQICHPETGGSCGELLLGQRLEVHRLQLGQHRWS